MVTSHLRQKGAAAHNGSLRVVLVSLVLLMGILTTPKRKVAATAAISGVSGKLFTGDKIRTYKRAKVVSYGPRYKKNAFLNADYAHCEHWAVSTTIFEPSDAIHDVCNRFSNYCLVVVADLKTVEPFKVSGTCTFIYYSVYDQRKASRSSKFASNVPWNHFGRKNLGYLFAISNGAKQIWDFDDDNMLLSSKQLEKGAGTTETFFTVKNFTSISLNPYPLLGAEYFSWPRGFPLDLIKSVETRPPVSDIVEVTMRADVVGVVQALANNDPDVDAIYRLQRNLPFSFKGLSHRDNLFLVPSSSYVPWNAQATFFRDRRAMWCAYLPISVHGRVSDIWRSLIAQRLFRDVCIQTAFMPEATVLQTRNLHSYLADFDAEQDLYYKSGRLIDVLDQWKPTQYEIPSRLEELYVELYERDFVGHQDVEMIRLWLMELKLINYQFPLLSTTCSGLRSG